MGEAFRTGGVKVEVKDLVKIYKYKGGEVQALRGVSASFKPGEITCIMGPSGSGKTTLLNLIGGIDVPTGGSIIVGETRVHELKGPQLDEYRLNYVGFVFQALNLIPTLSALENVMLPMTISRRSKGNLKKTAMDLLELVGIKDKADRKPEELSGGEQQRVAIAIALANDPPVILADEPTAELDSENAKVIVDLLRRLAKEFNKTVIMATHDPRVAVKSDRIIRLEDGRITGEHTPLDLDKAYLGETSTGVPQVTLAQIVKLKLSSIERDMEIIEKQYKEGSISLDEFHQQISRLKKMESALRELLTALGTE
ncbi:MAG: hypothetical protein DRO10_03135 [Thermoprotei archaeon]|nr:MAG: hypothetical protein DRO10_03135 [Thermoprotei archaeon]